MEKERSNRNIRIKTLASITYGIVEDNFTVLRGRSAYPKERKKVESVLDRVKRNSHISGLIKINNRVIGKSGKSMAVGIPASRQYIVSNISIQYHMTCRNNNE